MKQKFVFVLFIIGMFILLICDSCGHTQTIDATYTITITETQTQTETRRPTNTKTTKPSVTPSLTRTITETPYTSYTPTDIPPTKVPPRDLLISYSKFGNDSCPYFIGCLGGLYNYRFLLFSDGQIIIYVDELYKTTILSKYEIDSLLSRIEKTGYLNLERNDAIYKETPPVPGYPYTGGETINVKGRYEEIRVWEYEYLVDAIPETISIVSNYVPANLKLYFPDKVRIYVEKYQGFESDRVYGTPNQDILYWSEDSIPLEYFTKTDVVLPAKYMPFLAENLGFVPANQLVEQNGQMYQVMICPILPED